MPTLYNLLTIMEPKPREIPRSDWNATVEVFERESLLGEKHVDQYGRLLGGYDPSCTQYKQGKFKIFYRRQMRKTMREMVEEIKENPIFEGEMEEVREEAIELGDALVDILENIDPSSQILPWNDYANTPICPNMELMTACGRQSVHINSNSGEITQFWRPTKQKQWYDFDRFKYYLEGFFFEKMDLQKKLRENSDMGLLDKIKTRIKIRQIEKKDRLHRKIIRDSTSITRINFLPPPINLT